MRNRNFLILLIVIVLLALWLGLGRADVTTLSTTTGPGLNSSRTYTAEQAFAGGFDVVSGHIKASGTAPVVSACGVTPGAVTGSDTAGRLTTGSGINTSCTLTFATAYTTAPTCVVSGTFSQSMTATTTTTTLVIAAADLTSRNIAYICIEGS